MSDDKFNIEFEDDDETNRRELEKERKKRDEIDPVQLRFGSDETNTNIGHLVISQNNPAQTEPSLKVSPKELDEETVAAPVASPLEKQATGSYVLGDELKEHAQQNKQLAMEIEARVQIEVARRTTEIIALAAADAKLLDYKIGRVLSQLANRDPQIKKELMMIKRQLTEHLKYCAALGKTEDILGGKLTDNKKLKKVA